MNLPECPARGRIRKGVPDCFCRHPEIGQGRAVKFEQCWACPFGGTGKPIPPPRPKVGDVFAGWLKKWHRVTEPEQCDCKKLSSEMNGNGPDWCEANADALAGRVVENLNATKRLERKLPDRVKRAYFRWLIRKAAKFCRDWQPTSAAELA